MGRPIAFLYFLFPTFVLPSLVHGLAFPSSRTSIGTTAPTFKYTWTQSLGSVEICIPVPPQSRSKDLVVKIGTQSLKVALKATPEVPIIEGKLHGKVHLDESMWTLVDGKTIQINFEKLDNMHWWSGVVVGDPEIDTKKIVPENSKLGDLDAETRSTVEKMMYDQRQKQMGMPTSDQMKQAELLEKFKKSHPELDFSKTKVNWGGSGGFSTGM
eukprot:GHVT01063587.1.p1 GENE.GHVT01063587.1~~GHVT01063587.1.p1  ORF type:complete len:213 (+),score=33.25 GHVT01063587.1:34-672(+)